jgi:D-inositol-3-phosphate glycosyltransferase
MVSAAASPLAAAGAVDTGGQNVHVGSLAAALARAGHDVTVHTRRNSGGTPARVRTDDGVVVEQLDAGPAEPLPAEALPPLVGALGTLLADRLAADPPDVVHAHGWTSGLAALAGTRDRRVPIVLTFHSLAGGRGEPARSRMERALAHEVDRVLATCTNEVGELVRLGVGRNRITVVPSGVDVQRFSPDGPAAERSGRPRLLALGRLVPRKGFDTAIHALAAVSDAELLIAGGGAAGEPDGGAEARRLRALADRFGVADRVRLLGAVPEADVPALLRSADLVVCTPWYEPFGRVPVEAMACGVPVVASAVGGFLDTVVDGATGILVPPRRPDLLAAELRKLLAEPFWREAYGTAGVDRARARYSWERIAEGTLAAYEQACAGASTAAR